MKDLLAVEDLRCNREFWVYFFSTNYPNGYLEEEDIMLSEYLREKYKLSLKWVDEFTKYHDGILEEEDGYVANPRKIKVDLANGDNLEIEIHPGETIFFLNKKKLGCTGSHFEIQKISWSKLNKLLFDVDEKELKFFLLLPMVFIGKDEIDEMLKIIFELIMKTQFEVEDYNIIARCIIENSLFYGAI